MLQTRMARFITWVSERPLRYALVLLGLAVALRLPSLFVPIIDADEAMYANAARGILKNLVLYRDIVDQKPPLIYYLYAAIMAVINDVRFVHFVTIFIVWTTALVLCRTVRLTRDHLTGAAGGLLYVLFVSTIGQASNAEIIMICR